MKPTLANYFTGALIRNEYIFLPKPLLMTIFNAPKMKKMARKNALKDTRSNKKDAGIVINQSPAAFLKALKEGRFWEREKKNTVPA